MSLRGIAKETLEIIETGRYGAPDGTAVDLGDAVERAVAGSRTYEPAQLAALVATTPARAAGTGAPRVEVTGETTQEAARRLVLDEGAGDLVLLSFASARNPGGGFINGAKAQEEDLARCSALYACVKPQLTYYSANRRETSLLYTDHAIYSPSVPFFRVKSRELIATPFQASVITTPAPNAGGVRKRAEDGGVRIREALARRAGMVLAIAEAHGHRTVLLGAWGCGVFRNVPAEVAGAFGAWLEGDRFAGAFDRVVFAVLDRTRDQANRRAFDARFGATDGTP